MLFSVWSQLLSSDKATQTSLRFSQFEVSCCRTNYSNKSTLLSVWSQLLSYKTTQTGLRFSQFEVSCWRTKLLKQVYASLSLQSAAVVQNYSNKSTFLSVWSQLLSYKATQTSLRFSQFEVSCCRTKLLKQVYASLSLKSFVRMLYGRYHEMDFHDEIFFSQWQWIFLLLRRVVLSFIVNTTFIITVHPSRSNISSPDYWWGPCCSSV